jgi:hypothetical protein
VVKSVPLNIEKHLFLRDHLCKVGHLVLQTYFHFSYLLGVVTDPAHFLFLGSDFVTYDNRTSQII